MANPDLLVLGAGGDGDGFSIGGGHVAHAIGATWTSPILSWITRSMD